MSSTARAVVADLRRMADPSRKPGMARVGIAVDRALGVSIPDLRRTARPHRCDHELALDLWATGIHEARILASMVDDPEQVSRAQMDDWVADFDSWDLCDQVCNNLFRSVAAVDQAARTWARRRDAYVKRAAFTIVAVQAVHDTDRPDPYFTGWLPRIRLAATDERTVVRKAVSWALRQIAKRNAVLREAAIEEVDRLLALGSTSAGWIARDVVRDLRPRE